MSVERRRSFAACPVLAAIALGSFGCSRDEQASEQTFYDRKIGPVLFSSCSFSPTRSGCHTAADDRGNALGNLNVDSYQTLANRRDLLVDYGPYGIPGILLKVVPPFQLRLTHWDGSAVTIMTNVPHVGGSLIDITSSSYAQLDRWIDNGASENNARTVPRVSLKTPCNPALGESPAFDPAVDPASPEYTQFVNSVNPVLRDSCSFGNCHGNSANTLYLTCGGSTEQTRWNYFAASEYLSADANTGEMLRRALAPSQGGTFHEGGAIFDSSGEPGYQAILEWAEAQGGAQGPTDPGFTFFASRVQPMLVKRGCMMLGCHSVSMFHDYRLRGGSGGHFSLPATRKNYELTLEQIALESPDPNASRLIRKNLTPPPGGPGILHRGGALFSGETEAACGDLTAATDGNLDDQSPYCVILAWMQIERQARMGGAEPLSSMSIVYVRRPPRPNADRPQDWADYAPGADVVSAPASIDAMTDAVTLGSVTSLLGSCGLNASSTDARRPAASWDGKRVAFAARSSANEPFQIYVVEGGSCEPDATINAPPLDDTGGPVPNPNNELVHNFDPAFAPDGRIVFASTRGNVTNAAAFDYQGPQRTPADPSKLNSNLYVAENGSVRQLTYVLNQELTPSFMSDGRVIFVAEKRAPDFYQLAGRRINLDGGDYHPLFGQRSTIGYTQFTDVVELTDKNLAAIVSERGAAHGAGGLIIVNRSIGVDQLSQNPDDYTQDPAAIEWPNPVFYQRSIKRIDEAATGRLDGTTGAYAHPSPLPNGQLVVSYASTVNLESFSGNFDLSVVDPITGARSPLTSDSADELWPVAVYARQPRSVFRSRIDEANGASRIEGTGSAEITYLDVPLLASLLFQNTRTGRRVPAGTPQLALWESLPPEPGVTSLSGGGTFVTNDQYGDLYVRRRPFGSVPVHPDGSAKVQLPGGTPLVLETNVALQGEASAGKHFQREEIQFYPGETVRQGFPRGQFNGLCGGCHGSVSGLESQVAVRVDVLTSASAVAARFAGATPFGGGTRAPAAGPPFR